MALDDNQQAAFLVAPQNDEVLKLSLVKGFQVTSRSNFLGLEKQALAGIIPQFEAQVSSKTLTVVSEESRVKHKRPCF